MAITTDLELRQFLSSKDIPCHEVEILTGGTANFVWRIRSLLGRTSIIKHAEPFIRNNAAIAFPVQRMHYEHLALTVLPAVICEDECIRLPKVFHYFEGDHVIDMEDGGGVTLKDGYGDKGVDVVVLGGRIGKWLAGLHKVTGEGEVLERVKREFDNQTAKAIYRWSYNNLAAALKEYGLDAALGERINAKYGPLLQTDEVCLCHGDFWTGNLLLEDGGQDEKESRTPILTLVDWEMVRVGNGVTDVGQFTAEAWLLDRFHSPEVSRESGGRGLMESFLRSYLEGRLLSDEDKVRAAVHFATHIAYWTTRVPWTDRDGTKKVMEIGVEILKAVDTGDLVKLKDGPLQVLFEPQK